MKSVRLTGLPSVSAQHMAEVDRAMVEDYRIELLQMMENAGRHLAHLARMRFLNGDPRGKRVIVLAGGGGNGGGALVAARRLHTWGAHVQVLLAIFPERFARVPARQLEILDRMGVRALRAEKLEQTAELIVDGLIGYSLRGAPRGAMAAMIRRANAHPAPTLSLDLPSGLEPTTGAVHEPTIRAAATLTLALPKRGLLATEAAEAVGELYLADIGVPPLLYAAPPLELDVGPLFAEDELLRLITDRLR